MICKSYIVILTSFFVVFSATKRALFQNKDPVFWNGNSKLPVYSNPKEHVTTEVAVRVILEEDFEESMRCQVQPTCVDKNAVFVADLQKLSNPKDISCDDMGSWRANGTHASLLSVDRS